jgi:dihydropteroate synthase
VSWRVRGGAVTLERPVIVGIINVTPDSFSDGGKFFSVPAALVQAERLLAEGADVLDIGGESTRPQGAASVPAADEWKRIGPVIRAVHDRWPATPVSVDTNKASIAAAALEAGAAIINDVSGLRADPAMAATCIQFGAGLVIMHSRGMVGDMATYAHAHYGADVTGAVVAELQRQIDIALEAGVDPTTIVTDPGIGFAKRTGHTLTVLSELPRVVALGYPVLVGVSRKRFIGEITGVMTAAERLNGSIGASVAALARGARLFRVHDVGATREALDVAWAILGSDSVRDPYAAEPSLASDQS